ncbi:MAG: hypothetical protein KF765_12230 [Parvibaculaceae bacterium]|nr:hypothetical protein [Parvibaculaceae bacterium]
MNPMQSIAARMKDEELGAPVFRHIGTAAELAALKQKAPASVPACFIVLGEEAAEPSGRATGPVAQDTGFRFLLVIVTRNLAGRQGDQALDDIWNLKEEAKRRLVGFVPEGLEEPLENGGGNVTGFGDGHLWWEHEFRSGRIEEEQEHD